MAARGRHVAAGAALAEERGAIVSLSDVYRDTGRSLRGLGRRAPVSLTSAGVSKSFIYHRSRIRLSSLQIALHILCGSQIETFRNISEIYIFVSIARPRYLKNLSKILRDAYDQAAAWGFESERWNSREKGYSRISFSRDILPESPGSR